MRGSVLSILALVTLVACSGGDSPSPNKTGGDSETGTGGSATGGTTTGGTTTGGMMTGGTTTGGMMTGGMMTGGTTTGGSMTCKPRTCSDDECGQLPDGCGGLVDCEGCEGTAQCGIVTSNLCTEPDDLCIPLSKDVACQNRECGAASDGCLGTHDCGTCDAGDACGLYDAPHKCGSLPAPDPNQCTGKVASCASVSAECGVIGNGCGGTLDCDAELGGCPVDTYCGLGGPQKCGVALGCTPATAADVCPDKCGQVSDNCGGLVDCSADAAYQCPTGTACGAGGVANQCGAGTPDSCTPIAQAAACGVAECGRASDGCGGAITCGLCGTGYACSAGTCQALCVPQTKAQACGSNECGLVGDGCGGQITCGSCTTGEQCGAQTAFQCDLPPGSVCTPLSPTQACNGRECGTVLDGCGTAAGNQINCGTCTTAGEFCGLKAPFMCDPPDAPTCTAAGSCAALGWACGTAVDSCGNTYNCASEGRTCTSLQTCTGGVTGPTTCTSGGGGSTGGNCPLCGAIPNCTGQAQVTELTGRVRTPGKAVDDTDSPNQVGVPNAFVYILQENDPSKLPAIQTGFVNGNGSVEQRCDRCDQQDLGPVLVSATTDAKGEFTLRGNIPVGQEFVLVVKVGKWRRAQRVTLSAGAACGTTSLSFANTRLPRTMSDGLAVNIPHIAIDTGRVDAMECVFFKMGVQSSEFAKPNSTGTNAPRIHMYASANERGAVMASGSSGRVSDTSLLGTAIANTDSRLNSYDMLVFDCESAAFDRASEVDQRVRQFVNRGGRMFASHYSYTYIDDNGSAAYSAATPLNTGLAPSASWGDDGRDYFGTGVVSDVAGRPSNPSKVANFRDWLINENAVSFNGFLNRYEFNITDPRAYAGTVNPPAEEWVYWARSSSTPAQQFSFNTPLGAPSTATCGRVAYSGFHVAGSGSFRDDIFPTHCQGTGANDGNLTAQEKVLLYMLFDLGTCVSDGPPPPPVCTPLEANNCDANACGNVPDGCGGLLDCGTCGANQYCGADNTCVDVGCTASTCGAQGATCGTVSDGCGNILQCPACNPGQVCGLITPNQCTPVCTPNDFNTACAVGVCGFVSDGCGGVHDCGSCEAGKTCSGNSCQITTCTPATDCPAQAECGLVSDGCSDVLDCGPCTLPETCGGAGVPNECGRPNCTPLTCGDVGAECGFIGDGCGGAQFCNDCPPGQVCGLGGPNKCGGCMPQTCAAVGAECGAIGDGCGGVVQCPACTGGKICGALAPNKCGNGPACVPQNCADVGAECGAIGDGCGGVVQCPACTGGEVCGIKVANKCDPPPACVPLSCAAQQAECGQVGDGCGNLINCPSCPSGQSCGIVSPNKCDGIQ